MCVDAFTLLTSEDFLRYYPMLKAPISALAYGDGHIHQTYRLIDQNGEQYILQRINGHVFHNVEGLMQNILQVTEYLKGQNRQTLTVIKTIEATSFFNDAMGGYWRLYTFVSGGITPTMDCDLESLCYAGLGYGDFIAALDAFPACELVVTIPDFHATSKRLQQMVEAYSADKWGRADQVKDLYDYALSWAEDVGLIERATDEGRIPVRVTHNDTKVNNVLLCGKTREPLCVLDLDTIMPGSLLYDYGDGVRSSCSLAPEDEEDLSLVTLDLERYRAFTRGFLQGASAVIWPDEIALLPMGAILMTLECGMRFLTDYLEGDTYFRVSKPRHNLYRAKTQFKLVQEMSFQYEAMMAIVKEQIDV